MFIRQVVFTILCAASTNVASDSDALFDEVLKANPFEFSACEVELQSAESACTEPPGLETVTLTGKVNIEVILDASGSMAGQIDGRTKFQIAMEGLSAFVEQLPPHVNLGLRVYGHRGSNRESDKEYSCAGSDMIYPFARLDRNAFIDAVESVGPTGWTALGLSLERALDDFNRFDQPNNANLVYLLTDGKETCGGQPAQAAAALNASGIGAIVNVIGFDIDDEQQEELKRIASSGGGEYFSANDLAELTEVFVSELSWRQWREYFRCRTEKERMDITTYQQHMLDQFNCVLAEADNNTARIEQMLESLSSDSGVNSEVMLRIYQTMDEATEPYYQNYTNPETFEQYLQELDVIDARRKEMFEE